MASTFLTRTVSGSDSTYTYKRNTVSVWLKRSGLGDACFFEGWYSNAFATQVYFDSNTNLTINAASSTSGSAFQIVTNRKFRDVNSWYHIVISIDTTDATSTDRCKIYVNGVRETSFASASYPNQNASVQWSGTGNTQFVGRRESGGAGLYYNGSMSYLAYIDGTAELPTIFGETDTTTGQWKIKTSITPSVAWGNFGFLILKDGNSLTDASPNSNNFTLGGGTLTNTLDCPSNVFATLNSLWRSRWANDSTFEHGNTTLDNTSSGGGYGFSTLGMTSGKYYFEAKCTEVARIAVGVGDANFVQGLDNTWYNFNPSNAIGMIYDGGLYYNNTSNSAYYGSAIQTNDIVQIALDMDNYRMWFGINGTWLNSATQTQIENGTATYDVTTKIGTQNVINNGEPMHFFVADISGSGVGSASVNFGNGTFGTSAVTSAGTSASTPGTFEYNVPSGYQPLSTKGLNA